MRNGRALICNLPVVLGLALFLSAFHPNALNAKDLPSDVCTLLTPEQLQKTVHLNFGPAKKTVAPPAFRGQAEGTQCVYSEQRGAPRVVMFIVYADSSPAEATKIFENLSAWYKPTSKPSGIGDAAYIDKDHAIHVLKGNVRFFISPEAGGTPDAREKQAQELASFVAAQL